MTISAANWQGAWPDEDEREVDTAVVWSAMHWDFVCEDHQQVDLFLIWFTGAPASHHVDGVFSAPAYRTNAVCIATPHLRDMFPQMAADPLQDTPDPTPIRTRHGETVRVRRMGAKSNRYEIDPKAVSVMFYATDADGHPIAHAQATVVFKGRVVIVSADGHGGIVVPRPDGATHGEWHPHSRTYEFTVQA